MRTDRLVALVAALVGILLLVVGVIYLVENEHQIPSFFPGHVSHPASHHDVKHAIAAILLVLACLAFAWFRTGPRDRAAAPRP